MATTGATRNLAAWNADYYEMAEDFFWVPGAPGPRAARALDPGQVYGKLRRREASLNHLLLFFFRLAPTALVQRIYSNWFDEAATGRFEIQNRYRVRRFHEEGLPRPDLYFVHPEVSFLVETKLGTKSSPEQLLRYAVLSHLEGRASGVCKPLRLAYLGQDARPDAYFAGRPTTAGEVVEAARKRYGAERPRQWDFLDQQDWYSILERLDRMALRFQTFADLDRELAHFEQQADADSPYAETALALVAGLREELEARGLA